jgi:hypothetical protein
MTIVWSPEYENACSSICVSLDPHSKNIEVRDVQFEKQNFANCVTEEGAAKV